MSFLMCAKVSVGYMSKKGIAGLKVNAFAILIDVANLPCIGVTPTYFPCVMYKVPVSPQGLQQSECVIKPLDFCHSKG